MDKANTKKYRPVLSACMIDHIVSLAKTESPISSESITLLGILAPFQAKIQNEGITPAYVTVPTKSLEESLGLEVPVTHPLGMAKEAYWESCYNSYKLNPASCSLQEIQAAREHMYLEGLMSEEEVVEFEKGIEDVPAGTIDLNSKHRF